MQSFLVWCVDISGAMSDDLADVRAQAIAAHPERKMGLGDERETILITYADEATVFSDQYPVQLPELKTIKQEKIKINSADDYRQYLQIKSRQAGRNLAAAIKLTQCVTRDIFVKHPNAQVVVCYIFSGEGPTRLLNGISVRPTAHEDVIAAHIAACHEEVDKMISAGKAESLPDAENQTCTQLFGIGPGAAGSLMAKAGVGKIEFYRVESAKERMARIQRLDYTLQNDVIPSKIDGFTDPNATTISSILAKIFPDIKLRFHDSVQALDVVQASDAAQASDAVQALDVVQTPGMIAIEETRGDVVIAHLGADDNALIKDAREMSKILKPAWERHDRLRREREEMPQGVKVYSSSSSSSGWEASSEDEDGGSSVQQPQNVEFIPGGYLERRDLEELRSVRPEIILARCRRKFQLAEGKHAVASLRTFLRKVAITLENVRRHISVDKNKQGDFHRYYHPIRSLPVTERIMKELCEACKEAHRSASAHRSVSPNEIALLSADYYAVFSPTLNHPINVVIEQFKDETVSDAQNNQRIGDAYARYHRIDLSQRRSEMLPGVSVVASINLVGLLSRSACRGQKKYDSDDDLPVLYWEANSEDEDGGGAAKTLEVNCNP